MTVAPTTSFWDCGEFIAASYTLGVPHPPGAPLYLLIGRLFSMLPIAEDIGLRVNLISTLLSSITVLLLYLCIVRLARIWRGAEETIADKITVYGSAAVGALAFAFSHSFWFNAVEAEVYAVSMFFTALVYYLALRWLDSSDTPTGNRILLFIFYVVGLSSGIHLLNVLALMSITYIVAFKKYEINLFRFIVVGILGSVIILSIYPLVIQGLPTMIKHLGVWWVVALLVIISFVTIEFVRRDLRIPALISLSALLVIIGYSTYMLVKIRSGLDPFLDENNPETWAGLLSYLNREQYGSESLMLTMFKRNAPFWKYQISKMYIRYFGWQFFELNRFFMLPFVLGIIGAVHHFYKDAKGAVPVLILFLMTGLAIVLYLNQDDPQPRERDYAYVGSFFAFAIWIGLGALALVEMFADSFKKVKPAALAGVVTAFCFLLVPFNMLIRNYNNHSRSGNYVAWDYSYNLLNTCEKDAILFTNGDNDTFPLWYLQEVAGIRQDIRVVNLSLFNTGWFIKQIRDKEPKLPLPPKITDQYIENSVDSREISGLIDRHWEEKRRIKIKGLSGSERDLVWEVPATLSYPIGTGGRVEHFLRVQDMMILNTIAANKWEKPIYFAVTVSDQNLLGLRNLSDTTRNFLRMDGLAFRILPEPTNLIDPELMAKNLLQKYKYRNINNAKVSFSDNIVKLLGNYRQGLLQLALHNISEAQRSGSIDVKKPVERGMSLSERVEKYFELDPRARALTVLDFMEETIPEDLIPIRHEIISLQIGRLYTELGYPEEIETRLDREANKPLDSQKAFELAAYYLSEAKAEEKAKEMFLSSWRADKSLENLQRIAYVWVQFSRDTSFAADLYRRYLGIDDSRQAQLRIGAQAIMFGLDGLAFSIYEPLLQDNPNDVEAVRGMIDYYERKGDFQRGLNLVDSWLENHPDDKIMNQKRTEFAKLMGDTS